MCWYLACFHVPYKPTVPKTYLFQIKGVFYYTSGGDSDTQNILLSGKVVGGSHPVDFHQVAAIQIQAQNKYTVHKHPSPDECKILLIIYKVTKHTLPQIYTNTNKAAHVVPNSLLYYLTHQQRIPGTWSGQYSWFCSNCFFHIENLVDDCD